MYFKNVYFHNVASMIKDDDGYALCRLPVENSSNCPTAFLTAGVELRFKLVSDTVKITLLSELDILNEIEIYYGSFNSGLKYEVDNGLIEITVNKSDILKPYYDKEVDYYTPFSSAVVRIVLPAGKFKFVSIEGETELPQSYEMPKHKIAFVGGEVLGDNKVNPSSSTLNIVSQKLDCDYYNLTFDYANLDLGEISSYVASLDYDTLVLECGTYDLLINSYKTFSNGFKKFVKAVSKNKKRSHLIIRSLTHSDFKPFLTYSKDLSKTAKGFKYYILTDDISRLNVNPVTTEFTRIAYIELIDGLCNILDKTIPNFTAKDKKPPKNPNLLPTMADSDEPVLFLKPLTPAEVKKLLKQKRDEEEIKKANEVQLAKKVEKLRKTLIKNAKSIKDDVLADTISDMSDEDVIEYAKQNGIHF